MCGIAGAHSRSRDAEIEPGVLEAMVRVLVHRGPDDEGFHFGRGIGLGMRRLSIIDIAGGRQPVTNEDATVQVVCNGEIYNHDDLRTELEHRGHRFASRTDTEVLAHGYEEWGPDFVTRLSGMFGFALWDAERERLVIGRDRLGIKPVYLARIGEWLLFASEIKSLLQWPELPRTVNPVALASHMYRRFAEGQSCIFGGIERLQPGCVLIRSPGREETRRYWDVETRLEELADFGATPQNSHATSLLAGLKESVSSHLMSEVPLGAFLSGGLDSSGLVGLMSGLQAEPVRTYNVDFRGPPEFSEAAHASAISAVYGTKHRRLECGPPSEGLLRKIVLHLEEPIADPAVVPTYLVAELAAQEVSVVLTGEGSDEVNGGYAKYLLSGPGGGGLGRALRLLPAPLRFGALRRLALDASPFARRVERRLAWSLASERGFPIADTDLSWRVDALEVLDPELAVHRPGLGAGHAGGPQAHFLSDLHGWLPNDLLLKVDRMTMAHSLEARVPYLAHEVVELALSMPWQLKLGNGQTKRLLREALAPVVPALTVSRPQHGFNLPLQDWLAGPLAPLLDDLLVGCSARSRGYYRPRSVERIRRRARAGDGSVTTVAWTLMILELWHQEFMDRPPVMKAPAAAS